MGPHRALVAFVVCGILVACGEDSGEKGEKGSTEEPKATANGDPTVAPKPTVEDDPAPGGQATRVRLVGPMPDDEVEGERVVVRVRVNGKLAKRREVMKLDTSEGLSHLHFQLDGGTYDTNDHVRAVDSSQGGYSGSNKPRMVYRDVPPGTYQLRVELVTNDHQPASALDGFATEITVVSSRSGAGADG